MGMDRALRGWIDRQRWLDTLGDPLQRYLNALLPPQVETRPSQAVQNFLNGVWLGHPLHPVLTDVPVGAWTTTLVLDVITFLTENESLGTAADLTLATGLAVAVPTALTGLTDWKDTYAQERKVGLLHGLTMVVSVSAYSAALIARRRGARSRGVALASVGYVAMSLGAFMGGDEVYRLGYGVNHTAFQHGPAEFVPVMPEAELESNRPTQSTADGVPVVLVRQEDSIYALSDTCVHAGCSLAGGRIEGRSLICPCHGSQFDLHDGSVLNGPATMPEPHYDVRVRNGMIEVRRAGV